MNNRLNKLAEQSGFKLNDLPDDVIIPLEIFAEALIRECAKEVSNVYKQGGGTYEETILKKMNIKIK
jgi:uncharacterized protein YihD (DUF1040 family)